MRRGRARGRARLLMVWIAERHSHCRTDSRYVTCGDVTPTAELQQPLVGATEGADQVLVQGAEEFQGGGEPAERKVSHGLRSSSRMSPSLRIEHVAVRGSPLMRLT